MLLQAKQLKKWLDAYVPMDSLAATGTSIDVTADLTALLATAGSGWVAVPLQVGTPATQIWVRADAAHNKVELFFNATGKKVNDGFGNEVYGRITEALWVYTLTFYSMISGVETSYDFGIVPVTIDSEFEYLFDFYRLPESLHYTVRRTYDDLGAGSGTLVTENLPITALNTITSLAYLPDSNANVLLFINGKEEDTLWGTPSFSVAGSAITWSSANAGYDLETTDKATARYTTAQLP
jgi:hypothetical protein